MKTIEQIADELHRMGNRLQPLTAKEVDLIETRFKLVLPQLYKQFLRTMGNGAGNYMQGSSVFYKDIFFLRDWATETLVENAMMPLDDDAFVFWMHQGYQIAYFKLDEGDNPPVYFFSEGENSYEFHKKNNTLIDFFLEELDILKDH